MALNWNIEVYSVFTAAFFFLVICLLLMWYSFYKNNKINIYSLAMFTSFGIYFLLEGFAYLFLSYEIKKVANAFLAIGFIGAIVNIDLITKESLDLRKLIPAIFLASICIIVPWIPGNIETTFDYGFPSLAATGFLQVMNILMIILLSLSLFQWTFFTWLKAPSELKRDSFFLLTGTSLNGLVTISFFLTGLYLILPIQYPVASITAIITLLALYREPKILQILSFKGQRLIVISSTSNFPLFDMSWQEAPSDPGAQLAGWIKALQELSTNISYRGKLLELKLDNGNVIFKRGKYVTSVLLASNSSVILQESLDNFTIEFENQYKDQLKRGITNLKGVTKLLEVFFPLGKLTKAGDTSLEKAQLYYQLRESDECHSEFIESTSGLVIFNLEGIITYTNDKFLRMSGYNSKDLQNKSFFELLEGENVEILNKQAMKRGKDNSDSYEIELMKKDGEKITTLVSSKPIFANDNEYVGFFGVFVDITQRKKAEEELKRYKEHLEELVRKRTTKLENATKELEDFAYIVSHDLKAPLYGMHLSTLLFEEAKTIEERIEAINILKTRIKKMHNLIDGILKYSKVGNFAQETISLDINNLVKEVIVLLSPPDNVKIIIKEKLPVIQAEKVTISQIFMNIIGNAIKFNDKDKQIIEVSAKQENDFWLFRIADNGPGIEKQYHEKIFEIFQTVEPNNNSNNTGLGLAIVRKILKKYKGKIWVESEKGKSCTFYFALPLQIEIG